MFILVYYKFFISLHFYSNALQCKPDFRLLGECSSARQVILVDQLDKSLKKKPLKKPPWIQDHLGRPVDHRIGHHPGLSEGSAKGEAREDVPGPGNQ